MVDDALVRSLFFAHAPDLLCLAGQDGRFHQVNPAWTRTLGWSEAELLAMPWPDLIHPDDRERSVAAGAELRAGGRMEGFVNRCRCRDGSWRHLLWNAFPLPGDPTLFIAAARDISEDLSLREQLAEATAGLSAVLEHAPMGVHLWEARPDALVLVAANAAADRFTGVHTADLIGQPIEQAFPQTVPLGLPPRYRAVAEGTAPAFQLTELPYRDGRIDGWFDVWIFRAGPRRAAAFFLEVTERRRQQEQLHQAQKMEAVGQLAGGIAHDFNNMLAGIMGAAEMLARSEGPPEQRWLRMITDCATRASGLTGKLLAFGRRSQGQTVTLDLGDIVRHVASILEHTLDRAITLVVDTPGEPVWVAGDPSQLQSALLNLAINARDAMPRGGRLRIALAVASSPHPACRRLLGTAPDGPHATLAVTDTGCGIADAILDRVFEPFFTTKGAGEGSGLGLPSVWAAARSHGGAIALDTTAGTGAVFTLLLPLAPPSEGATPPGGSAVARPAGRGRRILVVDDEEALRNTLASWLASEGWEVEVAADGDAALLRCARLPSPDALLLDLVMPGRGGAELFHDLRRLLPDQPVVLMSGYNLHGLRAEGLLADARCAFLQKPFRFEHLAAALQRAFA